MMAFSNRDDDPFLSLIIPAYNEQARIADTLYAIKDYLSRQDYVSEIIVVDDGSTDLTTEVVKFIDFYGAEMKAQSTGILMENIKNVGKGFSIARGIMRARGQVVMFCDADLATPIEEIEKILPFFDDGYDVVIGSRNLSSSRVAEKSLKRRILSWGLGLLVRSVSVPGIKDTQCGFKAYRHDAADSIALLQRIYGFGFDIEHLFIAHRLGLKIREVGVQWTDQPGSTVNPLSDSFGVLRDLVKIRIIHWRLQPSAANS